MKLMKQDKTLYICHILLDDILFYEYYKLFLMEKINNRQFIVCVLLFKKIVKGSYN